VGVSGAALGTVLAGYRETLQRGQTISQNRQAQGAGPVPELALGAGPISPVRRPERVVEQARASVCLIQGSYVFRDKESGKPLRRAEWILDGGNVVLEDSFSATGFLISPDGKILTNRHVAQPWWENRDAEQIISKGYRPELTSLVAYFPGCPTPYGLKPVRISPNADLALLQIRRVRNLPAPLLLRTEAVLPGNQVLLIGYPAGVSPILRRSVQARLERIPGHLNFTDQQISRQLAQWKLIEPFVSAGCVSNVGAEVVTLSTLTSNGSSGSPVLDEQGRVLAIAFASLTQVAGGSLAVPARLAADLIGDPGECRRMSRLTSDANSSWCPPRLPGWKRRSSFATLRRTDFKRRHLSALADTTRRGDRPTTVQLNHLQWQPPCPWDRWGERIWNSDYRLP
jgi:S1-C subfamily serine protease